MQKTFIVDMFTSKIYGPYTNERKMIKDRNLVRRYSDSLLEVSSNIFVVDENDDVFKSRRFKKGDIEELRARKESEKCPI
jgi:hypothetical protein